ncbi:MAG: dihydroneopterin aldolase [Bacteroides sp.]|nr:dihydroneopterin aldolase [Bacteroides sp.]MCM1389482.1 dihydroneopterin aldolase [Bacteroides sp.]
MNTIIEINRLRLRAYHGVLPQENKVGNIYMVSVGIEFPYKYLSDDLDDTINYAEVIDLINYEMSIPSKLIEQVASRIHKALITRWEKINGGYVKIEKLHPPINDEIGSASVTLKW